MIKKYEKEEPEGFEMFVAGKSTLALLSPNPVTGRPEHNIWAVMETIYDDYKNNPEWKINEKLQSVLSNELRNEKISTYLRNCIEVLLFQMQAEKQNTAPFKLNNIKLLECLKQNISENRRALEKNEMIAELENYNTRIESNFNQRIM